MANGGLGTFGSFGVGGGGTPPAAPVITGIVDGGNGSSVVVSIVGTDTIRLFYRVLYASSWITGLTRSGSGDITQTGLSSGVWYEFYCVADDSNLVSAPSNIVTQRVSGTASVDAAIGRSPASIIANYVILELLSMTNPLSKDTWPLYISHMPDGKNIEVNCGAVYDTAGLIDGNKLPSGEVTQHPGIQLRIRSSSYETGFIKIEAVAASLDAIYRDTVEIDSVTYQIQNLKKTTPVIPLGPERGTKRRFLFTVNYLLTLKKVA